MTLFLFVVVMMSFVVLPIDAYCSREVSKLVRGYLYRTILPSLHMGPSDLLDTCPFHPSHDMYHDHEMHKHAVDSMEYKCGYCGKLFVNEFYIDRHMDRHHHNMIPVNATNCLADYCPILGCSSGLDDKKKGMVGKYVTADITSSTINTKRKSFGSLARCDQEDIDYTVRLCEDVSWKCFGSMKSSVTAGPPTNSNSSVSHQFINQVCHSLKCVRGVVKGSIHTVPDSTTSASFIYDLFRAIMLFVLVTIICVQAVLTDTFSIMFQRGPEKQQPTDYLSKYHFQRIKTPFYQRSYEGVVNAIDVTCRRVVKWLNSSSSSNKSK